MSFTSNTKSWKACDSAQQRTCKAHAAFTVFKKYRGKLDLEIKIFKAELLKKIKEFEKQPPEKLKEKEQFLIVCRNLIEGLDGSPAQVAKLETVFEKIESYASLNGISIFDGNEVKSLLKSHQLSTLLKAAEKFEWSGSSSGLPRGKSSDEIGISDTLLETIMGKIGVSALLSEWLADGDRNWWRLIAPEIEKRKKELQSQKESTSSDTDKIKQLEFEIAKLQTDWHL